MYFTAGKHVLYQWKYLVGQRFNYNVFFVIPIKAIFILLISKSIHLIFSIFGPRLIKNTFK